MKPHRLSRPQWIILGLAPLALAAGWFLHSRHSPERPSKTTLTRDSAFAAAHRLAAERGIRTAGWHEALGSDSLLSKFVYLRDLHLPQNHPLHELTPPASATAYLADPGYTSSFQVRLSPSLTVLGVRETGRLLERKVEGSITAEELRAQLLDRIPGGAQLRLGEPEQGRGALVQQTPILTWTWRGAFEGVPQADVVLTAETLGRRILAYEVRTELPPAVQRLRAGRTETLTALLNVLRIATIAALVLYGLIRFTRRLLNHEVPRGRALVIILFMAAFGIILNVVNPDLPLTSMDFSRINSATLWAIRIAVFLSIALQGVLLGLAYAASEGDLREAYPTRLTSLDTALMGRLTSANTGGAVVSGAALACWLFLLAGVVQAILGADRFAPSTQAFSLGMGRFPWLLLLLNLPTVALFTVTAGLMVPLTFLVRNVRRSPVRAALLVPSAILGCQILVGVQFETADFLVTTAALAAAVLTAFFVFDVLASMVTVVAYLFLASTVSLSHAGLASSAALWPSAVVAGGTLLAALWYWWRGRAYSEQEVKPQYVRVADLRREMEGEIRAAREAQKLLLPDRRLELPGVTMAASCLPAGEVGGDFYDFFVLPGGRLGFVLAEGGNDGLASALTIALAKGFLLEEVQHAGEPAEVGRALKQMLGSLLTRSTGSTSLAYGSLDPWTGKLRIARLGDYPLFHIVDGSAASRKVAFRQLPEGFAFVEDSLGEDAYLVAFTDGVPKRLDRTGAGDSSSLLGKLSSWRNVDSASRLHDLLRSQLLSQTKVALEDDLTLLVVGRVRPAVSESEAVA